MKKFTKVLAALGAVAMLGLGVFTSCGSDSDDDPVLKSIEVTTSPAKTEYTLDATNADGVALEAAGLVINTKWTEGKKDVEVKYDEHAADFSFRPSTVDVATAGTKEITVTYKKKTAKFNVTVKAASGNPGDETQKTITGIAVNAEKSTATYALDESLDVTITVTYDDDSTDDLTLAEFKALDGASVTGFDSSAVAADQVVTFAIGESISTTYTVQIKNITVTGVAVDSTAHKTDYYIGDELDVTGLTVKVTYSEGEPKTGVTVTADMVSGFNSEAVATDQVLTITYKEGITTTYKVNIKKDTVQSIALSGAPKVAVTGEPVYTGGMTVTATLLSGKTRELTADEYTVSPSTAITEANTEITVASTETATATAKFTITEVIAAFAKFDAADLRVANGGNATDTSDVNLERAKNTTETKVFSVTGNDTWKLEITEANKKAQVKALSDGSTYDEVTWTNRLSYNRQADGVVALKLRVGVKPVVLRVDGGSVKDVPNKGETSLKFSGSGDAITWKPLYAGSTTYVTIGGDEDGYVTITSDDTTNGANIWGITKVAEAVDLSDVDRTVKSVSYGTETFKISFNGATEGKISVDLSGENTTELATTVGYPTATTKTYTVKADGLTELADTTGVSSDPVTLTDSDLTYSWKKDGTAIAGATGSSYTASESGAYEVTVAITANSTTSKSATVTLSNSAAEMITVTFNAGEGTFTIDGESKTSTTVSVEKGKTLSTSDIPTATPTDNTKVFKEWTSSVDGITVTSAITQAVTFIATYDNRPSVSKVVVFDGATMTAITDLPTAVTRVDNNDKQSVDNNVKKANSKSFSYRFKYGGTGSKTANCLKVAMGTTSAVKVTVYAMCSNSSRTGIVTAIGSGDAVEILSNAGSELKYAENVSVTPDSDGNIYIYATGNAMNVYYLEVNP